MILTRNQSLYIMIKILFNLAVLSLLASVTIAEPPAYGSSSDEFDINSISSYLGDDDSSSSNKGVSYSYSNSYSGQSSGTGDRYKGATSHYTFGQKSPTVSSIPSSSAYSASAAASYNQAYASPSQSSVVDYSGATSGANTYGSTYDPYNGNPVGLSSYTNGAYSPYSSSSLVAHGTNSVPYTTTALKQATSPHSGLQSFQNTAGFAGASPVAFPTSLVDSGSTHVANPFQGHEATHFTGHNVLPSISHRPPYHFEKPNPAGPSHFISSYKGSLSPYNSFESQYSSKPPRQVNLFKGFSSGPPSHIAGPTGPSSQHFSGPISYKSPYYSEYKNGPGVYYSSRPHGSHASYSSHKSPNSYESISGSPYKYISDSSSRYPRFPGKYGSSRPGYSGAKISYSSRPSYKSYSSKPPSSSHSYSVPF